MPPEPPPAVALWYDPDGYVETVAPRPPAEGGAVGLMGRQVAGREFLNAYLSHGRWDTLTAVVRTRDRADPLIELCKTHPSSMGEGVCGHPALSRSPTVGVGVQVGGTRDTLSAPEQCGYPAPTTPRKSTTAHTEQGAAPTTFTVRVGQGPVRVVGAAKPYVFLCRSGWSG